MTITSLPDPAQVARLLREVASSEIMSRFRRLAAGDIAQKRSARDLVTIADIEAERLLVERLVALDPGSVCVGEEAAEADPGVLQALAGERSVWLLDPVDGTANYAAGKPCFAVIVGYCRSGETLAGWILDPVGDSVLWSVAGGGAWLQVREERPQRVRAAAGGMLAEMRGSLSPRAAERMYARLSLEFSAQPPRIARYGSAGREYMDLGTGALAFAQYTRLKPWDHAAGVLIHREAGGFSALRGSGAPYRVVPHILEETLLLAPDPATWRALTAVLA